MGVSHVASYPTNIPYVQYTGNGEPPAWPAQTAWLPFDELFHLNEPIIQQSCTQFGTANPISVEIDSLREAIESAARESEIDPRFVFTVVMQESNGCVRAPTTYNGVRNPGLMQDHNGNASCNDQGVVQEPCPADVILQMIHNGVHGTASGDGLKQCVGEAGTLGVSKYYRAARLYNSGTITDGDLGMGVGTRCFASDIANRLTGWSFAPHECSLDNLLTLTSSATAYQTITVTRTLEQATASFVQ